MNCESGDNYSSRLAAELFSTHFTFALEVVKLLCPQILVYRRSTAIVAIYVFLRIQISLANSHTCIIISTRLHVTAGITRKRSYRNNALIGTFPIVYCENGHAMYLWVTAQYFSDAHSPRLLTQHFVC